ENGNAFARIPLSSAQASTFQADHITLNTAAAVTEADSIIQDAHVRYPQTNALPEIGDDYSDEEELEWDTLFAQPHVQAGLDRLEEEAMRQFLVGKTVEGGFAVE